MAGYTFGPYGAPLYLQLTELRQTTDEEYDYPGIISFTPAYSLHLEGIDLLGQTANLQFLNIELDVPSCDDGDDVSPNKKKKAPPIGIIFVAVMVPVLMCSFALVTFLCPERLIRTCAAMGCHCTMVQRGSCFGRKSGFIRAMPDGTIYSTYKQMPAEENL